MTDWARAEAGDPPARVVDAGSGSGRFLMAAAVAFPRSALVAVEIDPLATLLLRANAAVLGFADRLTAIHTELQPVTWPRYPLGLEFQRLRSPETRREHGAIYTPSTIEVFCCTTIARAATRSP